MKKELVKEICYELYDTKKVNKKRKNIKREINNLNVGQLTNYYALVYFFKYSHKKAYELVQKLSYDEINKITNVHTSLEQFVKSFKDYFLSNNLDNHLMNIITGKEKADANYFDKLSNYIYESNNFNLFNIYLKIFLIANDIHNHWVIENAYKFNRDINKLYQHLPLVLIGEEEFKKDLIFIYPFFTKLGMNFCNITPNKISITSDFSKLYEQLVNEFLKHYCFNKDKDIALKKIIFDYKPLNVNNSTKAQKIYASERKKLMEEESTRKVLLNSLLDNNSHINSY